MRRWRRRGTTTDQRRRRPSGRVADDGVLRPERPARRRRSRQTRQRVLLDAAELGYQPNASARRPRRRPQPRHRLVMRQSPEQVASDAGLAETLRGLAAAARSGGFRVMVEPLAPDGPHATRRCSGPSTPTAWSSPGRASTTRRSSSWSATASRSCSRATCRTSRRQRGRRQRRRRARRGRAPDRPRATPDRLHHQRPARLHRRPGAAAPATARRSRPPASPADRTSSSRARSMPRAAIGRWPSSWPAPSSRPRSWRATSSRSAPSARCAPPACGCPTTCRSSVSTTSRSRRISIPPHHRPVAGLRARAGRRTGAAGPHRRARDRGQDAASDRARRPLVDGARRRRRCTGDRSLIPRPVWGPGGDRPRQIAGRGKGDTDGADRPALA